MEYTLFLDTNALLNLGESAFKEKFIISQKTLEEIEKIKSSSNKDGEIKFKARKTAKLLDIKNDKYEVVQTTPDILSILQEFYLDESPDNIILSAAYYINKTTPVLVVSDDINAKFISRNIFRLTTKGSDSLNLVNDEEEYLGYKVVVMTDSEMSDFYSSIDVNKYNLLLNQYLIIKNQNDEIVDYRRWNGETHKAMSYKQINSKFMGKIKPLNPQQVLGFDMLQNKDITINVLSGKFGTGKDLIMLSNALKLIDEGRFDKLIYVRNSINVKDSGEIGFLPGDKYNKLLCYAMPLADHLGGEQGLEMQILAGNIEIEHLGFIRGRDIKNSIIYCSESENMTTEHVQLLIGRVGEGSELWMNGDFLQTDSPIFRMNNGLLSAINKLKGHHKFGFVKLEKTERSETAAMADLLN